MSDPRAHQDRARQDRSTERVGVDSRLVARAVEINEAIAAVAAATDDPRDNPAVRRLEELGFATETIVDEVAGRAKQIFFYTRHGRDARSAQELEQELRDLTEPERAELVAVSVAWWDGVLTGLRARKLTARTHGRTGARP
jgi:hypothetical protein